MKENRPPGIEKYYHPAGGWDAWKAAAKTLAHQQVVAQGSPTLLKANQPEDFDCLGCAWPDPKHTSSFEFCENGAKAMTRVALWERDYSKLRVYLMELKAQGVDDLKAHSRANPTFLDHCIGLITVVDSNEAAREMLGPEGGSVDALRRSIIPGQEKFLSFLQAIMDREKVFEDKVEARADNGDEKLVLLSISFPEDPAAFNRVVVSMVDTTQCEMASKAHAEAQVELAKASKAATVGALSASLAHELNQPLGAIVVNAQTLLRWLGREPPDLHAVARSAERIIRDSQRASEILQNTRGFLSHENGKLEPVNGDDLFNETLALMEHELQRSGTAVNFQSRRKFRP